MVLFAILFLTHVGFMIIICNLNVLMFFSYFFEIIYCFFCVYFIFDVIVIKITILAFYSFFSFATAVPIDLSV